jgi:predicted RND superfamily exporter protein
MTPADVGQKPLPQGYRQGLVTAITVFLGFSLSFVRFWNFETFGHWTWSGVIPACLVAAGILVQLLALYRSLDVRDDDPTRYAATVRCFFAGILVVVVGLVFATIAA